MNVIKPHHHDFLLAPNSQAVPLLLIKTCCREKKEYGVYNP